jgi:hypothetical protein
VYQKYVKELITFELLTEYRGLFVAFGVIVMKLRRKNERYSGNKSK